ncbi:hypothetical protein MNBD_UNCLBAC01-210 [hydrothermal vent metagenome]|uniref:Glutathione S-transferase n=1 Tax=hydrothermal vent metagenome TaxID=652676 RepID=A0A3B1DG55_9ZZZZ
MVEIYGNDLSLFSNKVKLAANAIGTEYEFKNLDFQAGDLGKPEFLAINPVGKMPALKDGEFTLFESTSMIKYLADKQKSELYPQELQARYTVDKWLEFVSIHIGASVTKVLFNKKFAPIMGLPVDERSMEDGINFYKRFLPIVDTQLSQSKYLASDTLSLADITLLAILDPSEVAGHDITPYANVVKWREELKKEKFYTDSFKSYDDAFQAVMASASS